MLQLPHMRAETFALCRRVCQDLLYPSRFAIDPLPVDAALLGVAADVTVAALENDLCTGNPLLRNYDAHG